MFRSRTERAAQKAFEAQYLARRRAAIADRIRTVLAHVRSLDAEQLTALIIQNRVKRGRWWLARNAPSPGWWRNCLNGGRSRIRMHRTEESVLAFVFEYDARFADSFGYVQDYRVMKHYFGLSWQRRAQQLGFHTALLENYVPYPTRHPEVVITDEALTKAWSDLVEQPPGLWVIQHRHPHTWSEFSARPRRRSLADRLFSFEPALRA